jgi:ATP-dependent helicase/nuclease subunit A
MAFVAAPEQRAAADPEASVWVTANAGSGKTHVLVERVMRLMLDGAEPSSILCLTYTKAAAAEMSSRLFTRLGAWISLRDEELTEALARLGEIDIDPHKLVAARRLFTRALETPGGLKIQTIHAFCEKLLHLFPAEAGISPGFRLLSESDELELKENIIHMMFDHEAKSGGTPLSAALQTIVAETNIDGFKSLLNEFLNGAVGFRNLLENNISAEDYSLAMKNALGLGLDENSQILRAKVNAIDRDQYDFHAMCLGSHKPFNKFDVAYLMLLAKKTDDPFSILKQMAFTKDQDPRKLPYYSVKFAKEFPNSAAFLDTEKARITELIIEHDTHLRIEATAQLLTVADSIHQHIILYKRQQGTYDFDDLINATAKLLNSTRATQWVLYKLDAGLKHILVDEAQDTSPKQWQIVKALSDEFFAGLSAEHHKNRTLFVVGDRKQSIFSFQGADAKAMNLARQTFGAQALASEQVLHDIDLSISYRSTQEILNAVDKVFPGTVPAQLGFSPTDKQEAPHQSNRKGKAGVVEIWPLFEPLEKEEEQPWQTPLDREPAQHPRRRLAREIAKTIESWIGKRVIVARDRTVQPDDILILLQSRGPLFSMLISELRKAGVPVAGADRLKLLENLAVQDLLMIAQWMLLPDDDHALACILKSPFVLEVFNEDQLFQVSYDRKDQSLWSQLSEHSLVNFEYLNELLQHSYTVAPFVIFSQILTRFRKALAARLGTEAIDATDAFLDQVLIYESERSPSLAGFLHWFSANETSLKREMEKATGEVRLMTVHGAKGLEANIVFLPETTKMPGGNSGPKLICVPENEHAAGLPIWKLRNVTASPKLEIWSEAAKVKQQAERNRLLYVAMTRACDELYICGHFSDKSLPAGCWYETLSKALCGPPQDGIVSLGAKATFVKSEPKSLALATEIPEWLLRSASAEKTNQIHGLTHLLKRNSKGFDSKAARRGVAIHALLQDLPEIDFENRISFARGKAKQLDLNTDDVLNLVEMINRPDLALFFGSDSSAEVELRGTLASGQSVAGRIDRIAVSDTAIAVLDYKSDHVVPHTLGADHAYVSQMALYAALLREAYPDRTMQVAIIWTENASLTWLSPELLAKGFDYAMENLLPEAS